MIDLSQTNCFNPNQLKILQRNGIRTINELLLYIPRKYIDRSIILDLNRVNIGDIVTFIGRVVSKEIKFGRKRRLVIGCSYQDHSIEVVFFQGINYHQKNFHTGSTIAFSGALDTFAGRFTMVHPEFEIISGDDLIHTGKIVPFYRITQGMKNAFLTTKILRKAIHKILENYLDKIYDHLPEEVLKTSDLLSIQDALFKIHFPHEVSEAQEARKRLAFDEILMFILLMQERKLERQKLKKKHILYLTDRRWPEELTSSLKFSLTTDQKNAVETLRNLALKTYPFAALLQGDVGSGKTLVALLLALEYIQRGLQVAFMVPTEILAQQHYQNFLDLLSIFPFLSIELLLGRDRESEKLMKIDRIKKAASLLIVGTHSLLQEKIGFSSLGLVVIDEQHRFGVEQRERLRSKSGMPDILTMTATPIPRSLALILYGELENVQINEKPAGRLKIDTRLFSESELDRLYKGVKKYVDMGQQAYIVYPLIEESSNVNWASLTAEFQELERKVFKDYRISLLHSKLSAREKESTMRRFREGSIQIMVCTTVIEVGVDTPQSTVIVIRNADKFGISQLHQLRGRVGRGDKQSFCILVHSQKISHEAEQRLKAMVESDDGFFLAQKDLEIRGTGEIMGVKQAGLSEFKIADLRYHYPLIKKANSLLEQYPDIHEKIVSQKDWKKLLKSGMILFAN